MTAQDLRVVRRVPAPWRRVGDGVIVAPPGRQDFDLLSGPAAATWLLLDTGMSVAGLTRALTSSLDLSEGPASAEVDAVLADLASRGLVEDVAS